MHAKIERTCGSTASNNTIMHIHMQWYINTYDISVCVKSAENCSWMHMEVRCLNIWICMCLSICWVWQTEKNCMKKISIFSNANIQCRMRKTSKKQKPNRSSQNGNGRKKRRKKNYKNSEKQYIEKRERQTIRLNCYRYGK